MRLLNKADCLKSFGINTNKIVYLLTAALFSIPLTSCDMPVQDNLKTLNNSKHEISGVVNFPETEKQFSTKAVIDDIKTSSTISLIYPSDHASNPDVTIATGLSDANGRFKISTNFTPVTNEVYIIEASKRIGYATSSTMTMRTYIKWSGTSWQTITDNGLAINSKTTAITIIDHHDNSISPDMTINKISNGVVSSIGSVSASIIGNVAIKVDELLAQNTDPVKFIDYKNNEYYKLKDDDFNKNYFLSSKKCFNCNMTAQDLSGLDLTSSQLTGSTLIRTNLQNTNFTSGNLRNVDLSDSKITNTTFTSSDLSNSILKDMFIKRSNFSNSNLSNANISNSNMSGSNFTNTNFNNANLNGLVFNSNTFSNTSFIGSDLTNTVFNENNISGSLFSSTTKLIGTKMNEVTMTNSQLNNLTFNSVDLKNSDLSGSNLSNTTISNSNMLNLNLSNTNLTNANFSNNNTDISSVNISGARWINGSTICEGGSVGLCIFPETLVDSNTDVPTKTFYSVDTDKSGNSFISFSGASLVDGREQIYSQIFNKGLVSKLPFRINTTSNPNVGGFSPSTATALNNNGRAIVIWQFHNALNAGSLYGQMFDINGNKVGSEFKVRDFNTVTPIEFSVDIDKNGNFVVVWYEPSSYANAIFAQKYDSSSNPIGSAFRVSTRPNNATSPKISMNEDGTYVIVWDSTNLNLDVFARTYDVNGNTQNSEFWVNTYADPSSSQAYPSVSINNNDFVITWQSSSQDGSLSGIYAQRYKMTDVAKEERQGGEFRVNTYTTGEQIFPSVSLDSKSNFLISWQSIGQDGNLGGIFSQKFDSSGNRLEQEFQSNTVTQGDQSQAWVMMNSLYDFSIFWYEKDTYKIKSRFYRSFN